MKINTAQLSVSGLLVKLGILQRPQFQNMPIGFEPHQHHLQQHKYSSEN